MVWLAVMEDDLQDGYVHKSRDRGIEDRAEWIGICSAVQCRLGVFAQDMDMTMDKRMAGASCVARGMDCGMWIVGEWRR